jgi:hypothetical protein
MENGIPPSNYKIYKRKAKKSQFCLHYREQTDWDRSMIGGALPSQPLSTKSPFMIDRKE